MDGLLDRPLLTGTWPVPTWIGRDGEQIVWSWGGSFVRREAPVDGKGPILEKFVRLADAAPDRILDYARHWGPLGLFEDTLILELPRPGSVHVRAIQPHPWNPPEGLFSDGPSSRRSSDGEYILDGWEPLELWRHFARVARAMINVAAMLHQEKIGATEDWQIIFEWHERSEPWWPRALRFERLILAMVVNDWIELGNVRPRLDWDGEKPEIRFDGSLFNALTVQLMAVTSKTGGTALCSSCGEPYLVSRRPRTGENHYCQDPECGKKAAQRDAARRYRQKHKPAASNRKG